MAPNTSRLCLPFLAAGALVLGASAALAQDYTPPAYGGPPVPGEEVTVTAPHYPRERSEIGAPIQNVSLQRAVRVDDLDLQSGWGAHVLRMRVRRTAHDLCRQLAVRYPVGTPDQHTCYRRAYRNAMLEVHEAVASARYDTGRYDEEPYYDER